MPQVEFSPVVLRRFVETLSSEIGHDTFIAVLAKAGLPKEWQHLENFSAMDETRAAHVYARLQSALRTYYGRGARGILMRIGAKLWQRSLDDASLGAKMQAALIRGFPKSMRGRSALEFLARILGSKKGDITVHSLDLDLLLVDRASPSTLDQSGEAPICFVTFGLIRECLYWADGEEHDIEERACRGMGARQCEFKITVGG